MQYIQERVFVLFFVFAVSFLIYLLSPVLTPFLIAFFLAYLANPLVNQLTRMGLSRALSVGIVFIVFFAIITFGLFLLVPFVEDQINLFVEQIPNILGWIHNTAAPYIAEQLNVNIEAIDIPAMKKIVSENWSKANSLVDWLFKSVFKSGYKLFELLMDLFLIPVVTIYLLVDWNKLISHLRLLIPRRMQPTIVKLVRDSDEVLSAFIRGQLLVMVALGLIYGVLLSMIGLQMGLLIGLVAGLLCIVPYLGTAVGVVVGLITAYIQFGDWMSLLLVAGVFTFGQMLDHVFLTPKLIGNRIGLHPVAVIFAILAGGSLFGFVGVLLALPVAAVIMVWLTFFYGKYRKSALYTA